MQAVNLLALKNMSFMHQHRLVQELWIENGTVDGICKVVQCISICINRCSKAGVVGEARPQDWDGLRPTLGGLKGILKVRNNVLLESNEV